MARSAAVERATKETRVKVELNLEPGPLTVSTPVKFLNHMVETLIFYMGASGSVYAEDLRGFDEHHVVEDVAIVLGQALDKAIGDRGSIARFGWALVPMDDSLALASIDLGGRVYWRFRGSFRHDKVGDMSTTLIPHFIRTFATYSKSTIHIIILHGIDDHHKAEAAFKALGLSIRQALKPSETLMSLKGTLGG